MHINHPLIRSISTAVKHIHCERTTKQRTLKTYSSPKYQTKWVILL